jgi:hypothetical protein
VQQQTPVKSETALEMALIDIERALEHGMYYLALVGALTLIDMCAALESPDGKTNRTKMANWFSTHLKRHYEWLEGEDCYGLRCGLLHQGVIKTSAQGHQSKWDRTVFVLSHMRNCAANGAYITSLPQFCIDVCTQVKAWMAQKRTDPIVQKNMQNLMALHERGLAPYVMGQPLFA